LAPGTIEVRHLVREWVAATGSVVFCGRTGTDAAVRATVDAVAPHRMLWCRATPDDRRIGLGCLARLLAPVGPDDLTGLAPADRAAVLGLVRWSPTPRDPVRLRSALLNLVRGLAAAGPVTLVLENVQWLDRESAAALRFVAPRVADRPVTAVMSERPTGWRALTAHRLCPPPLLVVWPVGDELWCRRP
jgi:hypothetical protein